MRRPGVSGRVLGTMLLPLLLLSIVSVSVTADRHDDAVVAERITRTAGELESLVALRSAMLAERLAEEVTLTGRRPPKELARSSEFLNEVLDHPERVLVRTDDALDSVPDDLRPFDADDLAGVRTDRPPAGDSTALIAERWEPLQTALLEQMERSLRLIRMDAVLLGDLELAGATDDLDAAIAAPTRSAELLGLLTELWLAPPAERLELQAQLAAEDARFGAVVDQLARSAEPSVRALWRAQGEMPEAVAASMDIARRGVLGDPAREVGFPNEVGLSLLEGIDWAIDVDEIPTVATESVRTMATEAAEVARQAERTTALLTLVAVAASIGAALLFGRSIVAPVRRLTDQATSVGRGDLGVEPLALSGPPEVVRASAAFNDVVDNLVLLERKTRALADCDFEDTSLAQPLPGMLGASLQRSVKVLSGSIIERQQLQQRLVHQATHDALTGLANRAELVSTLTEAHQHRRRAGDAGTQVAVVFIDLDGFKRANDRYGHAVGDELLRVVARRLQSEVRREVLVARLGGDEFVVVMPAVADWHEPVALARRLVRTISEPVEVEGHWVRVGASAGVALSGTSRGTPTRSTCCVARTSPSTRPSSEPVTRSPSTTTRWTRWSSTRRTSRRGSPKRCTDPASCPSSTSRCSTRSRGTRWGSRRSCGGTDPSAARSPRRCSSRSPSGPGWSSTSTCGCWRRRWCSCATGRPVRSRPVWGWRSTCRVGACWIRDSWSSSVPCSARRRSIRTA